MIIASNEKDAIDVCINNAEKNPITISRMIKISKGEESPVGDNPNFVCHLRGSFRIVYSIEQHPTNWFRHISISSDGSSPLAEDFETIAKEFGFYGTIQNYDKIWIEHVANNIHAMNALQKYETRLPLS